LGVPRVGIWCFLVSRLFLFVALVCGVHAFAVGVPDVYFCFVLFRDFLAALYIDDLVVQNIASGVLIIAAG
jgi:hypothetical protein